MVNISYPSGAFTASGLTLNGGANISGNVLQLTDGGMEEARSVWFSTKVPVNSFTTDFTFQLLNPAADGFTFTIQNVGTGAVGALGGGLGYQGIGKSVAVKFDLYSNNGEGPNSTGLYKNGAAPTTPAIDLTSSGINLHSGDVMHAHMFYDGTALVMTLTDTQTNASATESFDVNIPGAVGGNSAYVGFTAGTGGLGATQNIVSWSYSH
jgi:Legume lectin domain